MLLHAIRPFAPADGDGVAAVWRQAFPNDPPWNAPELILARKREVQPELFLVADLGGAVVGTVIGGYDGMRGWIYHLAVDQAHRRTGIATGLMQRIEADLRSLGCAKINLQVRSANAEVIAFYRRLGFGVDAVVSMGKPLS